MRVREGAMAGILVQQHRETLGYPSLPVFLHPIDSSTPHVAGVTLTESKMRVGSLMKEFSGTVWPDLCLTVYEVQDAVVDKRRSLALWQPVPADYGHLAKVTYIPSHNAAAILFLRRPSTSTDINDQRQGSLDSNSDDR